jgi:hypothetical protein
MDVRPALIPDAQPPQPVEPTERAFGDPAMPAEPLTRLDALACNPRGDPAAAQGAAIAPGVIRLVGMELGRTAPRPAERAPNRRDGIHHRLQPGPIIHIGRSHLGDQGNALAIGQDVVLAAGLAAVGRVRARRRPPFWRAHSPNRASPATSRCDLGSLSDRADGGVAGPRRPAPASRADAASRSSRCHSPFLAAGTPMGCQS